MNTLPLSQNTNNECYFNAMPRTPQAIRSWSDNIFTLFDDGDIADTLDIDTLESEHLCGQSEPEYTTAAGGRYQDKDVIDYVGIGLNRDDGALSFELSNDIERVLPPCELSVVFSWYIVINTRTSETTVHYSEEDKPLGFIDASWAQWQRWLKTYKPLLYVHDYRQWVSPVMIEQEDDFS